VLTGGFGLGGKPTALEPSVEPNVERRVSAFKRIVGVLFSPTDTMEEIADTPDYLGVIAVIMLLMIVSAVGTWVILQKIVIVGEYAAVLSGFLVLGLWIGIVVGGVLLVGVWLVESLIVKYACDSGSGWSFKIAASITGYVWVISVLRALVALPITYFLTPTITIDTSGLPYTVPDYQSHLGQLRWMLVYSMPIALLFLVWTSYVSAKGVNYGTDGNCSFGKAFAVFFVLGFLVLLPSLLV
jgi:hypothetical protein